MNPVITSDFYEISTKGEIAVILIKDKAFDFITDINQSGKLIDYIDSLEHNPDIKALVFYNDPKSLSNEQYDKFMERILKNAESMGNSGQPSFSEKNIRFREINILNTIIKHLANLQVIVAAGLQGDIVTPFIGTSLVADFRYADEDAVFYMAHNRYGLHPSGGLPFFLSNYLHHSKALEIQLRESFTAKEALDLGLITKILPKENFEEHLLNEVRQFIKLNYNTIRNTKRLTNFTRKSLYDYFDYEAGLLNL